MLRVDVKKSDGTFGMSGVFETQAEIDQYVAENVAAGVWGKPARWVGPEYDGTYLEDISKATENREVVKTPAVVADDGTVLTPEVKVTEYHLPAEFTLTQSDITAQQAADKLLADSVRAQEVGALVLAKLRAINVSKNLSIPQLQTLFADQNLAVAERLLWTGSLKMAKASILAATTPVYTAADKAALVEIIDQSGLAL